MNEERYSWNNYKYKQHQNINLHMLWHVSLKLFKSLYRGNSKLTGNSGIGSCTEKNSASTAIQYKLYCNRHTVEPWTQYWQCWSRGGGKGSSLNHRERPGLEDRAGPLLASTSQGRSNSLWKDVTIYSIQSLFIDVSCSPSCGINYGIMQWNIHVANK